MLERIRTKLRAARHRDAVVLGAELAEAEQAEERHRRRSTSGPSAVAAVTYEPGETSLSRFQASPKDEAIRRFVAGYSGRENDERVRERDALTMDDFYTLLMFARRCCIAALRMERPEVVRDGLHALTAIDRDRVDWRDLAWAAALLSWAAPRLGLDPASELRDAAALAGRETAETLTQFADEPPQDLTAWGFRLVDTTDGPALVRDDGRAFQPTTDLLAVAEGIAAVFEQDAYERSEVTVGAGLPDVWLRNAEPDAIADAVGKVRAAASVNAELRAGSHPAAEDQMLVAFVAETERSDAADVIADAASVPEGGDALGVAAGRLCCVVIARSVVLGTKDFESAGALERFRSGIRRELERAA